ncbi:CAP domain-containing protein [Pseudoduganella sp. GCM10020061]|uniref:CAP domain-containing protein n=1 Tax=Pseudoduganella sp. GCM10020061 TaxID=3317345 RepID=UPI0036371745
MSTRAHEPNRWKLGVAAVLASLLLAACGGGGGGSNAAPIPPIVSPGTPGAPVATNNTAVDGRNWLNFRRAQAGMSVLTQNTIVDKAAQAHSDYQRLNDTITHTETAGKPGFTGAELKDRLIAAGYNFVGESAFGEVISATSSKDGFYMAEELITAIYHRFVIFEPRFEEIGSGSGTTASGYTYFTANFTTNNGYGPGLGNNISAWPFDGQTAVAPNFFSDYEAPDPVPGANEVGYPISVQGDLDAVLTTVSFTVRERGSSTNLPVRLLTRANDGYTPQSAAAIIPLAKLKGNTTYDASFSGTIRGVPVTKNWSFTTK